MTDPRRIRDGVTSSRSPREEGAVLRERLDELDFERSRFSTEIGDRPNNWNWQTNAVVQSAPRTKKELNREGRQPVRRLLSDDELGRRHHTPATFPRTTLAPGGNEERRKELEGLKQRLTFSDVEDHSDAEAVNKHRPRVVEVSERLDNIANGGLNSQEQSEEDYNLLDDPLESSQIVGRLMQIRDYIKQAASMRSSLSASGDAADKAKAEQLEEVVGRLKDQETKYLDLLIQLTEHREVEARVYDLQPMRSVPRAVIEERRNSENHSPSLPDVELPSGSNSEMETPPRPRIEDTLGVPRSDPDPPSSARSQSTALSDHLNAYASNVASANEVAGTIEALENDLLDKDDELSALRQQHALLKRMVQQQDELKRLYERQQALQELQQNGVSGASAAASEDSTAANSVPNNLVSSGFAEASGLSSELKDLRTKLDFLRNVYQVEEDEVDNDDVDKAKPQNAIRPQPPRAPTAAKANEIKSVAAVNAGARPKMDGQRVRLQETQAAPVPRRPNVPVSNAADDRETPKGNLGLSGGEEEESETSSLVSIERQQLRERLRDLQSKKSQMDNLLSELQALRRQRHMDIGPVTSETIADARLDQSEEMTDKAEKTESDAKSILDMLDGRKKMKKLQDVRDRLEELRDLVKYYQSGRQFIHGEEETSPKAVIMEESSQEQVRERLRQYVERERSRDERAEESASNSTTSSDWKKDPEIQARLTKLNAAKEKLGRLQELVGLVENTEITDLETLTERVRQTDQLLSESDDSRAVDDEEQVYEQRLATQQTELKSLLEERQRLLSLQDELTSIRNDAAAQTTQRPQVESVESTGGAAAAAAKNRISFQTPIETVISNDEVYGRMRRERMMKEELREKKKVLEDMMHKDRSKKSYGRNQDNQSDVTYSNKSDTYRALSLLSGDVTQATWGGSTADNLESVEETASRNEENDDAGFLLGGMVQAEEEEEEAQYDTEDDKETYTIEEDSGNDAGAHGFTWTSPNNQKQKKSANSPRTLREELRALRRDMANTNAICRRLERWDKTKETDYQPPMALGSPGNSYLYQYNSQLQQQQMLLTLSQAYQSLANQQQDTQQELRRLDEALRISRSQTDSANQTAATSVSPVGEMSLRAHVNSSYERQLLAQNRDIPRLNLDSALQPQPQRTRGKAHMTSLPTRPGLSSGISGTAFMDNSSVASTASTAQHQIPAALSQTEPSLFEALRETIYSEVAQLISQNEQRPHYLIELFRELQMLSTDYLRQRALYAVQDLVSKTLSDSPETKPKTSSLLQEADATPSESLLTSDEETDSRLQRYVKTTTGDPRIRTTPRKDDERFDYVERADGSSTMSTPTDSSRPDPFAQDLGDTVIHLDSALEKYRELRAAEEQSPDRSVGVLLVENDSAVSSSAQEVSEASSASEVPDADAISVEAISLNSDVTSVTTNSYEENSAFGSECLDSIKLGSDLSHQSYQSTVTSESGFVYTGSEQKAEYPCIDTAQLDDQIKAVLAEVIPALKEHRNDVCSPQLLAYLKRLVVSVSRQGDDDHEFAKFYHKQLSSILGDSLRKFEGRKMSEVGEDLLVELSEILFNELAFFRLMRDLADSKANIRRRFRNWRKDGSQTSTDTNTQDDMNLYHSNRLKNGLEDGSSDEEAELPRKINRRGEDGLDQELERFTKARDDEMASQTVNEDKDTSVDPEQMKDVQIQLAPSETKPWQRIGSDEDEEAEDEAVDAREPSETAVALQDEREEELELTTDNVVGDGEGVSTNAIEDVNGESDVISIDKIPDGGFKGHRDDEDVTGDNAVVNCVLELVGKGEELAGDPMCLPEPVGEKPDQLAE